MLALAGIAVAGYIEYARVTDATIACATGGCETVQESEYAELFGLPVAVLGLLAYGALVGTALVRSTLAAVGGFALALGGLAFSVYLIAVQVFVIEAWCSWCLASDAVTALLTVATGLRLIRV